MAGEVAKLNLRMPVDLREDAAKVAAAVGVSMNTFIVHAVENWTVYQAKRLNERRPMAYPDRVQQLPESQAAASREVPKVGSNQPCPCGSGEKYKRCHGKPGT